MEMVEQLMSRECKNNDLHVSSILRFWSMRTDIRELAKNILSIGDIKPSSPQPKRKGQTKTQLKNSSILSSQQEKVLSHLDSIRIRAPKNKLFSQPEIREVLASLEVICNESQKTKFFDLFSNYLKPAKKQRKMDKEQTP